MPDMVTRCAVCGTTAPMTAGDGRFIRPEGWTERTVNLRLEIRCPDCT